MKKFIIVTLSIAIIVVLLMIYFFYLKPVKKNNPMMAIPGEASMIFQMENPFEEFTLSEQTRTLIPLELIYLVDENGE